ncbi:CHAD domain-containing protein [Salinicoccus roseus]|uniref:CHAD domain-containing protein n=1 Tax=Salinicoccus roseus TaxID=45670 RepID=UPI0023005E49|nr:CHAD domain-containing protein [Salinicoccus roseus]
MEELKNVLYKRVEKLKKSYKDYENNPYHPKTPHALRVNSRKVRSLLNFLKHTFDEEEYERLNKELKDLAQIYGRLREFDVLIGLCSEIALRQPDLSDHYSDMFKYLNQERAREMRRTFNKTNIQSTVSAIESVDSAIHALNFEIDGDWDEYIGRRLKKRSRKLAEDYENVDMTDYEAVHDIRKRAKKLRYAARYFGGLTSKKHKKVMKRAKKIQDEFGEVTDARINQHLLDQLAEKVEDEDLEMTFQYMSRIEEQARQP